MEDDIEAYVKACHVCQVDKTECKKEAAYDTIRCCQDQESGEESSSVHGCKDRLEMISEAQDSLLKAQRRMKKYADNNRRSLEFNAGD
ncbi:hypothetical protein KY290_035084 [Solanum tuberosum]|uniref:Uncharacterized protein n=1 Tax=Solanum tuberosum TaxID=4113 RepID=A0ABQ7U5G8_SOLTU|nr:hypothetical protein KY289_034580 [Solanum tuberosum]KAH0646427.1 hypothetical protein KY284_034311 [Solanum tuberosum]KAH0649104.1 hypothetical protein KY285_034352 [Solanum tuberosum]KAH0742041.1 hypothetical protein KY290_035084 [Solanum tuberosum]